MRPETVPANWFEFAPPPPPPAPAPASSFATAPAWNFAPAPRFPPAWKNLETLARPDETRAARGETAGDPPGHGVSEPGQGDEPHARPAARQPPTP